MITFKRVLLLCTLSAACGGAFAQKVASGVVLDAETKEPLIGAVVCTSNG